MSLATMSAETPRARRFQRYIAFLAGAGMFIDGFDVSVIAVAMPGLTREWGITNGLLSGLVASSVVVGMFFGMMLGGYLVDKFGRRKMYMLDLIGFVVFALAAAITQNVWQLIAARFLLGIFIGADYPISSSMTAEFTAPKRRGSLIIFMSLMWQLGSFTAYILGIMLLPIGDSAWRWMLLAGAVFALVVIILRRDMPESPRWLRSQGREAEANAIEHWVADEHDLHIDTRPASDSANQTEQGHWRELFAPNMLRATIFCSVFWFAFAASFYGIQMYTPTILTPFTHGKQEWAFLGAALIAGLGVVGAGLGMFVTEWIGRRLQIIVCFAGMTLALSTLALWNDPTLLPLIGLLAFTILLANTGPGILNMVYPNEMFPTRLRGTGVGFAGSISRFGSIMGVLIFPVMVDAWGMASATWLFAGIALLGLLVSLLLAPETRGRSLQELDQLANNGWRDIHNQPVYYKDYTQTATQH